MSLLNEIKGWAKINGCIDYALFYGGKRWCAWNKVVHEVDASKYCQYFKADDLCMSFDGKMYMIMNMHGYHSVRNGLKRILSKYGMELVLVDPFHAIIEKKGGE